MWKRTGRSRLSVSVVVAVLASLSMVGCSADNPGTANVTTGVSARGEARPCELPSPSLRDLASRAGKSIGTAFRSTYAAGDRCYEAVAKREFNALTTEIGTMTNTVAPARGRFDFREADSTARTAARAGQKFDIHSLVWDPRDQQQWGIVPDYVRKMTKQDRHRFMLDLVRTIVSRYAGQARTATVVNEPFDQRGTLQKNTWWKTTGNDQYIVDAFRAARKAAPTMKLYLNEHSSETMSDKSNALFALAQKLRATTTSVTIDGKNVQRPLLDGVGFQAHMLGGADQQPSTDDMRRNLSRFADLGIDIRFTEVDVRIPTKHGQSASSDLKRQAQVYGTLTDLCRTIRRCTGMTLWGFTDKRSWITDNPGTFSGYGDANVLDTTYLPKPAWTAVRNELAK